MTRSEKGRSPQPQASAHRAVNGQRLGGGGSCWLLSAAASLPGSSSRGAIWRGKQVEDPGE